MSYPVGVLTRPLVVRGAVELETGEGVIQVAKLIASRNLVWMSTNERLFTLGGEVLRGGASEPLIFQPPVTDQQGYRDKATGAIIDVSEENSHTHTYIVLMWCERDGKRVGSTWATTKPFALPTGDLSPVDVDTLVEVGIVDGVLVSIPDVWSAQVAQVVATAEITLSGADTARVIAEESAALAAGSASFAGGYADTAREWSEEAATQAQVAATHAGVAQAARAQANSAASGALTSQQAAEAAQVAAEADKGVVQALADTVAVDAASASQSAATAVGARDLSVSARAGSEAARDGAEEAAALAVASASFASSSATASASAREAAGLARDGAVTAQGLAEDAAETIVGLAAVVTPSPAYPGTAVHITYPAHLSPAPFVVRLPIGDPA